MTAKKTDKVMGYKEIVLFTIPSTLSLAIEPLAEIIDNALIGHFNSAWLAGLAICTTLFASFTWIFNFLVHGVTARIGQAAGADNREGMERDFTISVILSVVLGVMSCALLILLKDLIFFKVMNAGEKVVQESSGYFYLRAIGMPFAILLHSLVAVLRGLKMIKIALGVILLTTLINALGSALSLYFFKFGFTAVGAVTSLSFLVGSLIALLVILKGPKSIRFAPKRMRRADLLSFGEEAWHMGGRTASLLSCFFLSTTFASRLGEQVLSAHQVIYQFWILASFIVDGIAITANALGAPFIGAGNMLAFVQLGRKLLVFGGAAGLLISLCYFFLGDWMPLLFTTDQNILKEVASVWPLIAFCQLLNALVFVTDGFMFALRDFRFMRDWMLTGALFVYLPIALGSFYFQQSFLGIWLGLAGLYAVRCVSNLLRFQRLKY